MRALLAAVSVFCACAVWLPAAADEQKRHFCGKQLAETLSELCRDRGGFNDPPRTRSRAASQSGVADNCCKQGCTWTTLRSYCKFDDVVKPPPPPPPPPRHTEACGDDDDDDDDELFSLPLLHREVWCGTWQPATEPPPGGEVECTCSRGGGQQPDNGVPKGRQPPTRQPRQPPRRPPTTPAPTPAPATRRPVVRGTVKPYFQGRPVVLSPPHAQRLPASA